MISKDTVRKTVVCYWSAENETFVAESAMIPHVVIGVGETHALAMSNFEEVLDDVYEELTADNVAGYKKGRPAKGYTALNVNVRPTTKIEIAKLSTDLNISQGEVLDYLVFYHGCKMQEGT